MATDDVIDSDDGPKEGLDHRDTGNIHVWIEGRQYKLRRPRGREFRKLRESWNEMLDTLQVISRENQEWLQGLLARGNQPPLSQEERDENQRRGRAMNDTNDRLVLTWWVEVIDTLGADGAGMRLAPRHEDGTFVDEHWWEDLPPWLGAIATGTKAIEHWRAVPSLSGAR